MRAKIQGLLKKVVGLFGLDIFLSQEKGCFPIDFSEDDIKIIKSIQAFTMTSPERICSLIQAVKYIIKNNVVGDMVECGVWRGGSMMAIALTLNSLGKSDRHLYLFDTYEGMEEPDDVDVSFKGKPAIEEFNNMKTGDNQSSWAYSSVEEVKENLKMTNYDQIKMHFIKGKVQDTIPENAPNEISLLRLDTDWYDSTRHELENLFPRLVKGGVLIIDDYGHWDGAKKAVDEYINKNNIKIFLSRIDYTGRIGIKL